MTALARALRLVAITDSSRDMRRELVERVAAAVRGGATSVQVRMKDATARELTYVAREIVACVKVPVLLNDRFDVALAAGAAGVHLGAEDVRPADVRPHVPNGFIIGASVGCDAEVPLASGADYAGIGPVFGTGSKSDAGAAIGLAEFARLAKAVGLPAVGIGGIDAANAGAVMRAGAAGVAAISSIFGSDDSELAAKALYRATEI